MTTRYLYLYGGAIGDALLGIHIGRTLEANLPGATIELVSTRPNPFVRELAAELTFIRYRELPKERLSSWLFLPLLMLRQYASVVYEPASTTLPLWWRLILWCARLQPGSVQVRYQMYGRTRSVPRRTVPLVYHCDTENFFDTPATVLTAWGLSVKDGPRPSLPSAPSSIDRPYILFHFFAGSFRRSIPVDHARAILVAARKQYPGHLFLLTCTNDERIRAERMCEGVTDVRLVSSPRARDMLGFIVGADLVVGTASGILLVAAHLQAPTVALSCLVHPCWLPTFTPTTTILAARAECRCAQGGQRACVAHTPEGEVFRCLFYIRTREVLRAMEERIKLSSRT